MDYVPNDIRPSKIDINLEEISPNIKLSISTIHIEYDCAKNSLKGICKTITIEINTSGFSTSPNPTAWRPLSVTLLCWEIFYLPPLVTISFW